MGIRYGRHLDNRFIVLSINMRSTLDESSQNTPADQAINSQQNIRLHNIVAFEKDGNYPSSSFKLSLLHDTSNHGHIKVDHDTETHYSRP